MDIKKGIGQHIKELRKRKNLTQEKLAELLNVSQNSMSYIETGENFLSAETLEKLAVALEVEPYEIFKFKHLMPKGDLLAEIITMLKAKPDKIPDIYKITKALTS